MSSRVDAGAVRAFNAVFTVKELSLWIDQVTTAHAHTTHTREQKRKYDYIFWFFIYFGKTSYTLLSIAAQRAITKVIAGVYFSSSAASPSDVLNGTFLVLPEKPFA